MRLSWNKHVSPTDQPGQKHKPKIKTKKQKKNKQRRNRSSQAIV